MFAGYSIFLFNSFVFMTMLLPYVVKTDLQQYKVEVEQVHSHFSNLLQ